MYVCNELLTHRASQLTLELNEEIMLDEKQAAYTFNPLQLIY